MSGKGKQAKVLTDVQTRVVLLFLQKTRYPERDKAMFLLSAKAGLRAKEISLLTWGMVTDGQGHLLDVISLENKASKGKSGRDVPVNPELFKALAELNALKDREPEDYVITSERGERLGAGSVVMWFQRLYKSLGFHGCSSHSGRRTFITMAARKATQVGASLRDVQQMAGHSSLNVTQRYIEGDSEAKRRLVGLL